jgi:hypothetical protein
MNSPPHLNSYLGEACGTAIGGGILAARTGENTVEAEREQQPQGTVSEPTAQTKKGDLTDEA